MALVDLVDTRQATGYFLDQLGAGNTLARLVRSSIELSKGRFRAVMPVDTDQGPGFDLRWDTFSFAGDEDLTFARLVKRFIRNPGCAVILQDIEASLSDPGFSTLSDGALAIPYGSEVYWSLNDEKLSELSDNGMVQTIGNASLWPFSAFFYINGIPSTKQVLDDKDLQRIAGRLIGVAVGAFDERSYLLWWRDDLKPFPGE